MTDVLVKTRPTNIKNMPNEQKLAALEGAYGVTDRFTSSSVLLIDDLFYSGSTLGHLAALLRAAGAGTVIGLVATKTLRS